MAATTFQFEVYNANANEVHPMKAFDAPSVATGDFDGDGRLEIVATNDNQWTYVLSSASPRVLAEFRGDYPPNWGVRPINDPTVGDVDNDGRLDIVTVTSAGSVCVHEYKSGTSTTSMVFEKQWCRRMSAYDGTSTAADGGAAIGDVNGDGKLEIFAQTESKGLYAFNWDGSVRWSKDKFGGNSGPLLTDLDSDGRMEVIFMSDGGTISAFDASSGNQKWGFWAGAYVSPASVPVSGNSADLDGDGKKETVFIARKATFCCTLDEYRKNHFMIFVLDHNGKLRWRDQPSWGNPMSYTHPILVDVNGDGKRDVVAMDWNTIGHKPGDWEKLGQANVFAYRHDGALLWQVKIDNSWSNDDLGMADVDGDGAQEILAIGYGPGGDGVWYLNARTGAKEQHVRVGDWTALRGPIVADFDKDGKTDWAIPVNTGPKGGGFRFYKTDANCNIAFGGWEVRDPCRKGSTGGGGGSPPPPGPFTAQFTTNGGNQWWVAVKVDANKPLAGVDARANGGPWHALELKWWGEWAGSFAVPDGSKVEFRARSTSGESIISGGFTWPAGTPSGGGGGGGGGGSFTATFKNVRGNVWWIETDASSSQTIVGVDTRLNGGAWTALGKTNWGSWAKSISAPSGTTVQFRAHASGGATALSGNYAWPPS